MTIDLQAAERFMMGDARLLDRHRLAVLLHDAPTEPALAALRAYRNPDGGFGHALEPDVRGPESEPTATLHALDVLNGLGIRAEDEPMIDEMAAWVGEIAEPDGAIPSVMPTAAAYPHAPWMVPSDSGAPLTFALAAGLYEAGAQSESLAQDEWLARGTEWCWAQLADPGRLGGYGTKFALGFLDVVPDETRAVTVIESLRGGFDERGSLPVSGGTADERLTALDLSGRPGRRSRVLFSDEQIEAELDALEGGQQDDGGWVFDWLAWSPAQAVEWRGAVTLRALETLAAHGRL